MKSRKPRLHMYELERMSVQELKELLSQVRLRPKMRLSNDAAKLKSELIDQLVRSGRIDIIAVPEPVRYKLRDLQAMGVKQLKACMADAGVFFDPLDVVEKSDMVRIFRNSGRLDILPDPAWEQEMAVRRQREEQEQERQEQEREYERRAMAKRMREEAINGDYEGGSAAGGEKQEATDEDMKPAANTTAMATSSSLSSSSSSSSPIPVETVLEEEPSVRQQKPPPHPTGSSEPVTFMFDPYIVDDNDNGDNRSDSDVPIDTEDVSEQAASLSENNTEPETKPPAIFSSDDARLLYYDHSVHQLRNAARRLDVDLSNCIERTEMINKLAEASEISQARFVGWSVSAVRALASSVHVDLSDCTDKTTMVEKLVSEAQQKHYVAVCILAWMPLAGMSLSELRGTARQWRINVMDCLEKEEIIQRLASSVS